MFFRRVLSGGSDKKHSIGKAWSDQRCSAHNSILSGLRVRFSLEAGWQAAVLLALFFLTSLNGDIYFDQVAWLCTAFTGILFAFSFQYFSISLCLLFSYVILSVVWHFYFPGDLSPGLKIAFDLTLFKGGFFYVLGFSCACIFFRDIFENVIGRILGFLCLLTLCKFPVLPNSTQNGALLACLLPFAFNSPLVQVLMAAVVFTQMGSTTFAIWAVVGVGGIWALSKFKTWVKFLLTGGVGLGILLGIWLGIITRGYSYGVGNRYELYKHVFKYWRDNGGWFFGYGFNSFEFFGPIIQRVSGFDLEAGQVWLSLHSDWLNILFELGVVGLAIAIWVYLEALYKSSPQMRLSLVGFGIYGIFNFPLDTPIAAFFVCFLLVQGLNKKRL